MPANVESLVLANRPAWHQEGTVLDTDGKRGLTVEVAMEESGIAWTVGKYANFGLKVKKQVKSYEDFQEKVKSGATLKYSDLVWVKDRHTVQRETDSKAMGVVGNTWQPVQNQEGFTIITDVIQLAGGQDYPIWIEAAGALHDGRVWILAHVDDELQIAGEAYKSYLLFWNGHNGRSAVGCALIDERVVCANTLDWGIQEAKGSGRIVRVRHTVNAGERIKEAAHILGLRNQRKEELARQGEWLVEQSWDEEKFEDFLQTLMVLPEEEGTPAHTMISQRQDQVRGIYHGPTCEPIKDTAWGALHAVAEYSDHGRNFTNTETQLKAQWGLTNTGGLKQQAYELALDMSGFSAN